MSYKVFATGLVLAVLPVLVTAQTTPAAQSPTQTAQTTPDAQATISRGRAASYYRPPVAGQGNASTVRSETPFIPPTASKPSARAAVAPPVSATPVAQPVLTAAAPAIPAPAAVPGPNEQPASVAPVAAPTEPVQNVSADYRQGQLTLLADRAPLGKVLELVGAKTGASIELAPELASELVVARLGPATPNDVLSALLESPKLDYIILASGTDGGVQKVVVRRRQSFGRQPIGSFTAPNARSQQSTAPAQADVQSGTESQPQSAPEQPTVAPQDNPPTK